MVKIREVRPEDAEILEEVTRASWIEGQKGFLTGEELKAAKDSSTFEKTAQGIKEKIDSGCSLVLVAVDEEVVGRLRVSWGEEAHSFVEEGQAQLRSLYVDPERWREGIGTELVEEAFNRVSFEEFVVEVFRENRRAVEFYRGLGFREFGEASLGPKDVDLLFRQRPTELMKKDV
ncbi:MAG: GNAT family N-acetyltransferase [Candidatus Nanohaloarchaea archaeon]